MIAAVAPATESEDCNFWFDPMCAISTTTDAVGGAASSAASSATSGLMDSAMESLANQFADTANDGLRWMWGAIDTATSVDLTDPVIRQPMAYAVGVALVLTVGLFIIQVVVSALRRDPGGLARAGKGMLMATIGAPAAIAITQLLIAATDALCDGLVEATTGQPDASGLGTKLIAVGGLALVSNVAAILISLILLVSTVMVWASLMVRKVLILITAVFAPIAFAGAASDLTTKWVRQVCEVMIALIISKFVMVMIFSIGYNMLVVPSSGPGTEKISTLAAGVLILLLAGLAPIAAMRMVTFASGMSDQLRMGSDALRGPARSAAQAPQKIAKAGSAVTAGVGATKAVVSGIGNAASKMGATGTRTPPAPTNTPSNPQAGSSATGTPTGTPGGGQGASAATQGTASSPAASSGSTAPLAPAPASSPAPAPASGAEAGAPTQRPPSGSANGSAKQPGPAVSAPLPEPAASLPPTHTAPKQRVTVRRP